MKVIPSNQALILANERDRSGGVPAPIRRASGDAVLRRVTVVAVQADYSDYSIVQSQRHVATLPARGITYTSSRSIALYASTGPMPADTAVKQLDVHA